MRKTYLYMTAVAMSAALAAGCQKAEPVETTAAAETVAESTGTGTAESESSETSGTAAQAVSFAPRWDAKTRSFESRIPARSAGAAYGDQTSQY